MRARVIKTDGTTEPLELPSGSNECGNRLAAMYQAIGCTAVDVVRVLDAVPGRSGVDMWIDDEGLYKDEPEPNKVATLLANGLASGCVTSWITGSVVVTGGADSEGDTLPLTPAQDWALAELAGHWRRHVEAVDGKAVPEAQIVVTG